jgi:hypothetical protein
MPGPVVHYYGAPRTYSPTTGPVEVIPPVSRLSAVIVIGDQPTGQGRSAYDTRSGRILRELGMPMVPWLNLFERRVEKWNRADATASALQILAKHGDSSTPLLLLGPRVCDAFTLPRNREWLEWYRTWLTRAPLIAFPNPAVVSRWWKDPANVEAAGDLLRALAEKRLPRTHKKIAKEETA